MVVRVAVVGYAAGGSGVAAGPVVVGFGAGAYGRVVYAERWTLCPLTHQRTGVRPPYVYGYTLHTFIISCW